MNALAAPSRAEAIDAVLEACDGHYGRVIEHDPPGVRILYRPPMDPPRPPVAKERRMCARCWDTAFVVPEDSQRRYCNDCIVYLNRSATTPDLKPNKPEVNELNCPFCGHRLYIDRRGWYQGVRHRADCPERCSSANIFMRKVARALGAKSCP